MPVIRGAIISLLLASPVWAEAHVPVIGAKRTYHHAAPLPIDGEGDYGFSGTPAREPADTKVTTHIVTPDADLLAYEEEEALLEAEAAMAADDTRGLPVVVID